VPDDLDRDAPQLVVLGVGQRLARGNDRALAGVHPHRVEVFHVADDDAVVEPVPHDLVFDFLPASEVLLDEHLRAVRERLHRTLVQLLGVGAEAGAQAPQRVRRPHHDGVAHVQGDSERLVDGGGNGASGDADPDLVEALDEEIAILRFLDRADRGAEDRHAVALQHAGTGEREAAVERRLAAEAEHDRVGALELDNLLDELGSDRQEVHLVGEGVGGLNRRDVRVDENRFDAFFLEGLDGLAAGVVELPGFADLQRTAAEQQHFPWMCDHRSNPRNSSNRCWVSTGPGAASGWNCTLMNGRV
jgi:hypothetical protein